MTALTYRSGEEILAGDRVRYLGEVGVVEFAVPGPTGDPQMDWYADHFSRGVMVQTAGLGSVFVPMDDVEGDVEFVSRGAAR